MNTFTQESVVGADVTSSLPDWLSIPDPPAVKPGPEVRQLTTTVFEMVFPRILEQICSGSTLQAAINDDHRAIDSGAFLRWIKKDPERSTLYKEAKEIRTESWAGKIIEHATAEDGLEDVQRSRLVVDTYKWLMASDNRKTYGETKQIDFGGTISITGALAAARSRVMENELVDMVEDVTPRLENN
jgi:hypothetical protein